MPDIRFQPKQYDIWQEMQSGIASWIGVGGGRGAAKSAGIDRIALANMMEHAGSVSAVVMRTYPQVRKYHIEPMFRAFPELQQYYISYKGKLKIPTPGGHSELDLGYAENYNAVENFFRSGNYKYIYIDQAEQFTEAELREIKKACRWPGGGAKMLLSFNMGGIGIGFLRKIFQDRDYNDRDNPANYKFFKVNPWDNVFWVTDALTEDGLNESDYYAWTDEQRQAYAAMRGEYTRQLNADDEAIRARDWFGSWESLEGAYFGRVFAPECVVSPDKFLSLVRPWWKRWMSGDWGFGHWTGYYWHARGLVEPSLLRGVLGIDSDKPMSVIVTYREWLGQGMSESQVAQTLVSLSDDQERGQTKYSPISGRPERVSNLYFSPDAFEASIKRSGQNTIADELGKVLTAGGLPYPTKANNARVPGWRAMYGLLANTLAAFQGKQPDTIWLIADTCPELVKAIPLAMRDQKNLEDIVKTDKGEAVIGMDALDGCRYGILCREVSDRVEPQEAKNAAVLAKCPTPNDKYLYSMMLPKTSQQRKGFY